MPRIKATPESIGIGSRIRKERELRSLTREKLAELLDLTPGYIADLERGEARLSVAGLVKLCETFSARLTAEIAETRLCPVKI